MIEPTESEPKAELDRFVEAMLSIRADRTYSAPACRWTITVDTKMPLRRAAFLCAA